MYEKYNICRDCRSFVENGNHPLFCSIEKAEERSAQLDLLIAGGRDDVDCDSSNVEWSCGDGELPPNMAYQCEVCLHIFIGKSYMLHIQWDVQ